MNEADIEEAAELLCESYSQFLDTSFSPSFFPGGKGRVKDYLAERVKTGNAITLKINGKISGYFAWSYFDFHNERSAFSPVMGHCGTGASRAEDRAGVYLALYRAASAEWIKNGAFNHLWMIFAEDEQLKKQSYDLGFGSYVADAFTKIDPDAVKLLTHSVQIKRADKNDCDELFELVEDSRRYYYEAPLFLKRKTINAETIKRLIEESAVFLAYDTNSVIRHPVGFINVTVNNNFNAEQLIPPFCACIEPLGIYVKPDHRGKAIGKSLLAGVFQYCHENSIEYAHVDYETANAAALNFWPKYFSPAILSVRRSVNKDAC